MKTPRSARVTIARLLCAVFLSASYARSAGLETDDLLAGAEDAASGRQDALLRASHLSEVFKWPGVAERAEGAEGCWTRAETPVQPDRIFARPAPGAVICTAIDVPAAGDYRIWLGCLAAADETHPVALSLEGATTATHVFGAKPLPRSPGAEVEAKLPVRFDGERERGTWPVARAVVWEYWDLNLAAGPTVFSLASSDAGAMVDALFLSRDKDFAPGGSRLIGRPGTFNHIYYRFRVTTDDPSARDVSIAGSAAFIVGPTARGPYSAPLPPITSADGRARVPVGAWSAWMDATSATNTRGAYVNATFQVEAGRNRPLAKGRLEAQSAWLPRPGAVTDFVQAVIEDGAGAVLVPAVWKRFPSPDCPSPQAGVASFAVRAWSEEQRLRTHRQELEAEIARIPSDALKPGVMPERLRILTLARLPKGEEAGMAAALLKRTGFNFVYGIPQQVKRENGLCPDDFKPKSGEIHRLLVTLSRKYGDLLEYYIPGRTRDPNVAALAAEWEKADPEYRALPHLHPMGDEIGPAVDAASISWVPAQRKDFQGYLRKAAKGDPSFFGAASFDHLEFLPEPSGGMTRAERRLYYHSAVYRWRATADYYAKVTDILRQLFPNILTMANYSPYTVFYYGKGMDHGQNSFALPRQNACTAHWGEDWLPAEGVASLAGAQTESFFASVLRCGAALHRQPTGIYLVWKLGDLDRKMGLLVSNGMRFIHLYYWGPRYLGGGSPESSSHRHESYGEINRGARAIGPADEIIADGAREPAQAALLYNRTDEMWKDGSEWRRTDRLYTFLALRHAHVPADLVLEDDLCAERLRPYRIVYLNGPNIRRDAFAALRPWVEAGGVLYAVSGSAQRDEYDDPLPEAADLFGAAQIPAGTSQGSAEVYQPLLTAHKPIDTVTIEDTPYTPALRAPVVGVKTAIVPQAAAPLARYEDGSCAGAWRQIGKGAVVLLGVMPGYLYAHNAPRDAQNHPVNYTAERRALIAKAALAVCRPSVAYTEPLVEVARFDHDKGIAIMLTDVSYRPGAAGTLTVRTDRKVKDVTASLAGPMKWRRAGDSIEIERPIPSPLDVVIIR